MPDPRQIVESIRAFVRGDTAFVGPPIMTVAGDYAEMCREANLRLGRCADFLHEGLVGEAVEFSAFRPPLLEMIAALSFEEVPDWDRMCAHMGLPRAEALGIEAANILGAARQRYEPIRELLGKYRYLALARGPLSERLAVAWNLAAADPSSVIWEQEADELEKSRLVQLLGDADGAIQANDVRQMDKLLSELGAGRWKTSQARELREKLQSAATAIRQTSAISELTALVPKARQAIAAQSLEQSQAVFAQWGRIVKESRVPVPPELRQEIMPLVRWIDDEDERRLREKQFRAACSLVVQAVQTQAPIDDIKQLYAKAAEFGLEIPDAAASAYRRATESARQGKLSEQRKQYALAAGLVGAILAALGTLAFVIFRSGKH